MTLDTEKAVATKRTESKSLSGVGKRKLKARFDLESEAEMVCGEYRVGTRSGLQAPGIVVFITLLHLLEARVTVAGELLQSCRRGTVARLSQGDCP